MLLAATLAVLGAAAPLRGPAPQSWVLLPTSTDEASLRALSKSADIFALFEESVLAAVPVNSDLPAGATLLGERDDTPLSVVECPLKDCTSWMQAVDQVAAEHILASLGNRVIVRSIPTDLLIARLPGATEAIPVRARPIVFRESAVGAPIVKNAIIEDMIAKVSENEQRAFLDQLTNDFFTRLSTADESKEAADWLLTQFTARGLSASLWSYPRPGYPPNVVAEIRGSVYPDRIVIAGAHFDDRASNINNAEQRAPGANDDGSGTAALFEMARILANYTFENTIRLVAFSGEEQGLYGSTAYAAELADNGVNVVAMFQSDMIAQRFPGNPAKLEMLTRYCSTSLNTQVIEIVNNYVPTLEVGINNSACCSDQQPFFSEGYLATAFVEAGGYTIDPDYHQTTDVVDRDDYSLEQLGLITQSVLATIATFAVPV